MTNDPLVDDLQFRSYWIFTAWLSLVLILILSIIPVSVTMPFGQLDKAMHVLMYIVPASLFGGAYINKSIVWATVGLFVFSGSIELVQYWLPWRSGDWLDLLANLVGIGIGIAIASRSRQFMQWLEAFLHDA